MTRQIKFRAWQIDWKNNGIEQGRLIQWEDIRDDFAQIQNETSNFILMQFTGLLDSKGKEIYEGDIVKNNHGVIWSIEWIYRCSKYVLRRNNNTFALSSALVKRGVITVVGNIYENSQLLTDK